MYSFFKPLIIAVVVGGFVHITRDSENSPVLNFVMLYIILTVVSWLFEKFEEKRRNENETV